MRRCLLVSSLIFLTACPSAEESTPAPAAGETAEQSASAKTPQRPPANAPEAKSAPTAKKKLRPLTKAERASPVATSEADDPLGHAAGMTFEHALAMEGPEAVITGSELDVVVATVTNAPQTGTNGAPPQVSIRVDEVLAGPASRKRLGRAEWAPFPHDVDWSGEGADERLQRWSERALKAPAKGSQWILAGELRGETFSVWASGRWECTPEKLAWARAAVDKRPR